jgi:hypothetical protein
MAEPLSIGSAPESLLTEDGLHRRIGSVLLPVEQVSVSCPQCGEVFVVKSTREKWQCPHGHCTVFVECKGCNAAFQRPEGESDRLTPCSECGRTSKTRRISAWLFMTRQKTAAPAPGGVRLGEFTHVIRGITLAASGGTAIPNGSRCLVGFGNAEIQIAREPRSAPHDVIPYAEVQAFETTGTTTRRSAGIMGGGFGLTGAAEGILAATVINSLTARRRISTVLRIATVSAEYVFVSDSIGNDQLRMFLIPIQPRIRGAQATAPASPHPAHAPAAAPSVADELAKLAKLRNDGVLSEAEFALAKARLLEGM